MWFWWKNSSCWWGNLRLSVANSHSRKLSLGDFYFLVHTESKQATAGCLDENPFTRGTLSWFHPHVWSWSIFAWCARTEFALYNCSKIPLDTTNEILFMVEYCSHATLQSCHETEGGSNLFFFHLDLIKMEEQMLLWIHCKWNVFKNFFNRLKSSLSVLKHAEQFFEYHRENKRKWFHRRGIST